MLQSFKFQIIYVCNLDSSSQLQFCKTNYCPIILSHHSPIIPQNIMLYPKIHAHFLFFPGLLSCFEIIVLFQSVTFRSDPLLLLKSECLLESQINSPFLLVKSPSQVKSPFFAGGSTVSLGRNLDVWPVKTLSEAPPWARSGC